eukprot:11167868-Lingulodinium_polyedra.AAC.1
MSVPSSGKRGGADRTASGRLGGRWEPPPRPIPRRPAAAPAGAEEQRPGLPTSPAGAPTTT